MARSALIAACVGVLGLLCEGDPRGAGFPPLPGPDPNAEAVAVSAEIASSHRPVFYVRDAQDEKRLLAYDWSGSPRGAIEVSASEPFGVYPSEDGTMLLLTHAHIASGGRAVGRVASGVWAGDNAHLCTFLNELGGPLMPRVRWVSDNIMEGISTPATLFYETATGATRRVLPYGEGGAPYAPAILACSSKSDRAVIRGSSSGAVSGPIVVRLSDGQLISQGSRGPYRGGNGVLVSMDGTLLALGSTDGISVPGKDAFTVFGLPSNNVVAEFIGKRIEAFSADGTRILTVEDVGSTNEQRRYQLVDLATSRSLWTSPVLRPATVLTRPGSGDFLIAPWSYEPSEDQPNGLTRVFADFWLVSADGSAKLLLEHVAPLE